MAKSSTKKATNLSIDSTVLSIAKDLNINLSEAAEQGIVQAINKLKAQQWKAENQAALESSNDFVEKNGLPLHLNRLF